MTTPDPAATLGDTDHLHVTLAAARAYAEAVQCDGLEAARRDLLRVLLPARRQGSYRDGRERWRARSRTTGLDVEAGVAREVDGLVVVVSARVRFLRARGLRR